MGKKQQQRRIDLSRNYLMKRQKRDVTSEDEKDSDKGAGKLRNRTKKRGRGRMKKNLDAGGD